MAYNDTVDSVTNFKPLEVIYGQLDTNSPLDIEIYNQLVNNYFDNHKNKKGLCTGYERKLYSNNKRRQK